MLAAGRAVRIGCTDRHQTLCIVAGRPLDLGHRWAVRGVEQARRRSLRDLFAVQQRPRARDLVSGALERLADRDERPRVARALEQLAGAHEGAHRRVEAIAGGLRGGRRLDVDVEHADRVAGRRQLLPRRAEGRLPFALAIATTEAGHPNQIRARRRAARSGVTAPTRAARSRVTAPTRAARSGVTAPTRAARSGVTAPTRAARSGVTAPTRAARSGVTAPTRAARSGSRPQRAPPGPRQGSHARGRVRVRPERARPGPGQRAHGRAPDL